MGLARYLVRVRARVRVRGRVRVRVRGRGRVEVGLARHLVRVTRVGVRLRG